MEFFLVLFLLPIIVLVTSIIGFLVVKKWFVMPFLTFVVLTILTFTVFNETFFIWAVVFSLLSLIISLIMNFLKK